MAETTQKPKVAVVGTGGTISSMGKHRLELMSYINHGEILDVYELLTLTPEVNEVADVVPVPYAALVSPAIGPPEWLALLATVNELPAEHPDLAGIVITHGTATLEETAWFLNLTARVDVPIVVVGAQRPATGLSSDGPLNLVNAIRVAGSSSACGLGVLVVMNDEINAARDVTKTSGTRLQTFRTPDFGVLGHVDEDAVAVYRAPLRRHAPDTEFRLGPDIEDLPRVDVVTAYAGADGTAVDAFVRAGARGLVAVGFPPGLNPPAMLDGLRRAREQGLVIVQASRAIGGRAPSIPLLQAPDTVLADNLDPVKARILLMLALTRTSDTTTISEMFARY